ncbi:WAT1-related protein [Melia azedarach]|uniref:WAT1-related protein n=1 Tax=Melia azedarach TaxID=155640 RepID=A0ACC1YZF3_MELAZ|nr:WAT1-related protein [Melia azedarach]
MDRKGISWGNSRGSQANKSSWLLANKEAINCWLLARHLSGERGMIGSDYYKDVLLFAGMVAVECTNVGLNILYKAATNRGMSYYVFIVYSYAVTTLVLLPLPYIFRSRTTLPPMKFPIISRIFLLGLVGALYQILGYTGIGYSTPTLASLISNLNPAFTFTLAVIFRMEKLALRRLSSQAKIIGTAVSIAGATVVVLYKGPIVLSSPSSSSTLRSLLSLGLGSSDSKWVLGGLLLTAEYLLISIWYIIQTQVTRMYPAKFVVVLLYSICATIISAPLCYMAEPNLSAWIIKPDMALVSIIYAGLFGISFATVIHTFGLYMKGPVYTAIFKPLSIFIAAIASFVFLGDALYLGSVIGAVVICVGFYAVIWGKANEEEINDDNDSRDSKTPLLQSQKTGDTEV